MQKKKKIVIALDPKSGQYIRSSGNGKSLEKSKEPKRDLSRVNLSMNINVTINVNVTANVEIKREDPQV